MTTDDKTIAKEITYYWTQAQPVISSYISSLVHNFQDAEDILQTVALAVAENFDRYDREASFVAWAIAIARHKVYQYYRQNAKNKKILLDNDAIGKITEIYEKSTPKVNETRQALEFCIGKLKGRWKEILEMRYYREFSTNRIAQHFGLSNNAVFITLHRVRLTLENCIKRTMTDSQ